jgi:hypothetical protein
MPSLSERRLVTIALDALEEAFAAARERPVKRTWALRPVLAFLASRTRHGSSPERWPFDNYWRALAHERPQDRAAILNAALNAIYLAVGEKRDVTRASLFEQRARETVASSPDS